MRFSLFTIIAGASRSSRRLSRLLRLITRRYRSLRSDAAKRPPSELDHRAQIGRNDRDDVQDHVRGAVAALQEGVNDLEALDGLRASASGNPCRR